MTLLESLRRATSAIEAKFADGEPSLTAPQYQLLLTLEHHEGKMQRELTDMAGMDRGSASDVFRRLDEDGLITRTSDISDRRAWFVYLTDEGRDILKKAKRIMASLERELETSGVDIPKLVKGLNPLVQLRPPQPLTPPNRAHRRAARA